jgi:hypothetical protein
VQSDATAADEALATKHGVPAWGIDVLTHRSSTSKVLAALA